MAGGTEVRLGFVRVNVWKKCASQTVVPCEKTRCRLLAPADLKRIPRWCIGSNVDPAPSVRPTRRTASASTPGFVIGPPIPEGPSLGQGTFGSRSSTLEQGRSRWHAQRRRLRIIQTDLFGAEVVAEIRPRFTGLGCRWNRGVQETNHGPRWLETRPRCRDPPRNLDLAHCQSRRPGVCRAANERTASAQALRFRTGRGLPRKSTIASNRRLARRRLYAPSRDRFRLLTRL